MLMMEKQELVRAGDKMTGGNVAKLSNDELNNLVTVVQFVFGLCLNEIEARGELKFLKGKPFVPYCSEYDVPHVLTRS